MKGLRAYLTRWHLSRNKEAYYEALDKINRDYGLWLLIVQAFQLIMYKIFELVMKEKDAQLSKE